MVNAVSRTAIIARQISYGDLKGWTVMSNIPVLNLLTL